MKSKTHYFRQWTAPGLLTGAFLVLFNGCSTGKPPPEVTHQRGWIGGEYKLAQPPRFWNAPDVIAAFPKPLRDTQKAGVLVTALSTNTPARLAGLREGDLILALDHRPAIQLADFRRAIEQSAPGTVLPVKLWRGGQMMECDVPVGRETFKKMGTFSVGLFWGDFDLRFNPGFSLFVAGYEPPGTFRTELGSVKSTYRRICYDGKYEPTEQDWAAWLGILRLSKGKTILAQENVPPR